MVSCHPWNKPGNHTQDVRDLDSCTWWMSASGSSYPLIPTRERFNLNKPGLNSGRSTFFAWIWKWNFMFAWIPLTVWSINIGEFNGCQIFGIHTLLCAEQMRIFCRPHLTCIEDSLLLRNRRHLWSCLKGRISSMSCTVWLHLEYQWSMSCTTHKIVLI